jgi:glycosyltransferase involved in cell wall biosynthesis
MALDVPEIALVIVTRNRGNQLFRTLESLKTLRSRVNWELIVVDNGSTDSTGTILGAFASAFAHPMRIIYESAPGQGNARNAGWQSTEARIVAFLDDDCYPAEDYLEAVLKCFAENLNLGFLSGRILLYDQTDLRMTIQESLTHVSLAPKSFIRPGFIQGANSSFRRVSLEQVGGFDPRFGGAKGQFLAEELDVAARISAAGWHGAYDPRPLVYHHHGRKTRFEEWRLMRVYQRGIGGFYAKCCLDRQLRTTFLANFRTIRKLHSYRGWVVILVAALDFSVRAILTRSSKIGGSHIERTVSLQSREWCHPDHAVRLKEP